MKLLKLSKNVLPAVSTLFGNLNCSIVLVTDSRADEKVAHYDTNTSSNPFNDQWKELKICWIKKM